MQPQYLPTVVGLVWPAQSLVKTGDTRLRKLQLHKVSHCIALICLSVETKKEQRAISSTNSSPPFMQDTIFWLLQLILCQYLLRRMHDAEARNRNLRHNGTATLF